MKIKTNMKKHFSNCNKIWVDKNNGKCVSYTIGAAEILNMLKLLNI